MFILCEYTICFHSIGSDCKKSDNIFSWMFCQFSIEYPTLFSLVSWMKNKPLISFEFFLIYCEMVKAFLSILEYTLCIYTNPVLDLTPDCMHGQKNIATHKVDFRSIQSIHFYSGFDSERYCISQFPPSLVGTVSSTAF